MKELLVAILALIFFLSFSSDEVYAASIAIGTGSAILTNTDDYTVPVTLTVSAADTTQYYLRGVFAKQGSTNYCGYTWNGTSWFNGPYSTNAEWKSFLPVTITNNSWSGEVKAKLDFTDSGCSDSGIYIFKIERFTNSGSGTFDSQNEQTIQVTLPIPTPTFTPTPQPQSTNPPTKVPTPTATKSSPTYAMTSLGTSVAQYNPNHLLVSIRPSVSLEPSATVAGVLGIESIVNGSPTIVQKKRETKVKGISQQDFPLFLALGGIILLGSCGIVFFQIVRKRIQHEDL